jgi:hypothetical protein
MSRATRMLSSAFSPIGPSEPGTHGTPCDFITRMAETLSPMMRMVSALGPTNTKPLFSTRSAKSALSDRKP